MVVFSDGLFTLQIFRQSALAQHAARAFVAAADDAVVAGVGLLADVVQRAHFIRQRPSLCLGQVHQRRVDLEIIVHRQIKGNVHGFDEHVAAVGIAGEVGFAHARDDVPYPLPFGVNRGVEQEKRVATVYKGIRNAVFGSFDGGGFVHQGIVRNLPHQAQVEYGLFDAQILRNPAGAFQLDSMALPVLESDSLDVFASVSLNRLNQAGSGILAAGEDDQGLLV